MNKQIEIVTEDHNWFGDSVFTFRGESYNFYQHNCSDGRQLIKDVKSCGSVVLIYWSQEYTDGTHASFTPALPRLEEMLKTHDEVDDLQRMHRRDTAGNEIAGMYGY